MGGRRACSDHQQVHLLTHWRVPFDGVRRYMACPANFLYCHSLLVLSGEGGNPLQMGCVFLCYCTITPLMIICLYYINAILGLSTPALALGIRLTYQAPAWMACSMH